MKKITKIVLPIMMLVAPFLAFAVIIPSASVPVDVPNNPPNLVEIQQIIEKIARFMIMISVVVAVIAIVWGAIVIMTAGGSEDRMKIGKGYVWKGIIGAAIVFAVGIILQTVAGLVTRTFFG
jgi:magnesium-transporting ATPase (P-type)